MYERASSVSGETPSSVKPEGIPGAETGKGGVGGITSNLTGPAGELGPEPAGVAEFHVIRFTLKKKKIIPVKCEELI